MNSSLQTNLVFSLSQYNSNDGEYFLNVFNVPGIGHISLLYYSINNSMRWKLLSTFYS